jgi:predicted DNA-binding protein (MmcQ/YjbR family)
VKRPPRSASTPPRSVRARKAAGGGAAEGARLRRICLAIPGAVEKASHGEPTWFTGPRGKVFAMFDNHHHGGAHVSVYVPAPPGVQQGLVASQPDRYWVPPYVGHKGWVAIILDTGPAWDEVASLVQAAFQFVAKRPPPASRRTRRARPPGP